MKVETIPYRVSDRSEALRRQVISRLAKSKVCGTEGRSFDIVRRWMLLIRVSQAGRLEALRK
jgi:hypothetical protein